MMPGAGKSAPGFFMNLDYWEKYDKINAYVEKMRESGNTNITYEYILDTVHDKNLLEVSPGDQTVTYDELIYSWRDHNESKEYLTIDTAYSHYIIDTFSACTGKCNGECSKSSKTCTEICNLDYNKIKAEIDEEIKSLIADLSTLYNATMKTNDEYNQYLGASYISVLSSASIIACTAARVSASKGSLVHCSATTKTFSNSSFFILLYFLSLRNLSNFA